MADVWGILGQQAPAAATLTAAYTVPAAKHATVEVVICNRAAATTVRVSHAIAGAADAVAQYILYDFAIGANISKSTARFTAKETDVIRGYSASGSVSFNVYGIEESD